MREICLRVVLILSPLAAASCGGDDGPSGSVVVDGGAEGGSHDATQKQDSQVIERATCTITISSDSEGDGTINAIQIQHVTSDGRVLSEEYDAQGDGTIEQDIRRTYDENGNVTLQEVDSEADGTVEQWTRFEYDANDNRTLQEQGKGDAIESRVTYQYDAQGSVTVESTDSDANGEIDNVRTHKNTHDDGGRLVRVEVDITTDGSVDLIWDNTYNGEGQLTETRTTELTGEFAGQETFSQVFYNDDGTIDYTHQDSDGDGQVDMERRYGYDERAAVISFEWKRINTVSPQQTILLRTVEYAGTCSSDYVPELR